MLNYLWFFLAALFEIAGCFAFFMWLRQGWRNPVGRLLLGSFLALAVSLEDLGLKTGNSKAKLLAKTLDSATGKLLKTALRDNTKEVRKKRASVAQ